MPEYYRTLTIAATAVTGTLTNFPVLYSLTNTDLRHTGSGGNVAHASGFDIRFFSDESLTTKLDWEVESYVSTTGQLIAWIRLPSITNAASNTFFMSYGSTAITTFQGSVTGSWDSNYLAVYHAGTPTATGLQDSTSYAHPATGQGGLLAASGTIHGALDFGGTTLVDLGRPTALDNLHGSQSMSFESWLEIDSFPDGGGGTAQHQLFARGWVGGTNESHIRLLDFFGEMQVNFRAVGAVGSTNCTWVVAGWATGTAHHLAATFDGTNKRIYFDGVLKATEAAATGFAFSPTARMSFGGVIEGGPSYTHRINGRMDEVRISNTARSSGYIATSYRNQSNPSTFITLGTQTLLQSSSVSVLTNYATATVFGPTVQITAPPDSGWASRRDAYIVFQ